MFAASRKPNSVPAGTLAAAGVATIIPLASPSLARSSDRPGSIGRAVLERFPIWSCSVRGFACHPCYHGRGALLPHLFTLTRLRPPPFGLRATARQAPPSQGACLAEARGAKSRERRRAVSFLCHFPSGCPDRALPGALPCGVRTFLPAFAPCGATARRPSCSLRSTGIVPSTVGFL